MTIRQSAEVYAVDGDNQYINVLRPSTVGFEVHKFYCNAPVCNILEMAWATSMQCRFTGHLRRRYSVAEHCMLVARLMQERKVRERGGTAFEALMHDQHEGYISDLAAPWKVTVKDFKPFEIKIETAMREQFGLPAKHSEGVKWADWLALFIEAESLQCSGATEGWYEPEPGTRDYALELLHDKPQDYTPKCYDEHAAFSNFMGLYHELKPVGLYTWLRMRHETNTPGR
jgi:hypothetical protein